MKVIAIFHLLSSNFILLLISNLKHSSNGWFMWRLGKKSLILFENLFKLRQRRLAVGMLLTSSVSSTTSKQCFEQPAANFLVCSLIFIEYKNTTLREEISISQILGKCLHSSFYWTIIGWYRAFCNNIEKV